MAWVVVRRVVPKLTIIIPTFNSAETIVACLESVRRQTFSDYEVLVQDGGSRDNTLALISEFATTRPEMTICVAQEPDGGVYDAMNKAMERATGEWLYFLGSDDELYGDNAFGGILDGREANEANVLYGNARIVRNGKAGQTVWIYDGPFDLSKLLHRNISHQAILYRRAFATQIGPFNTHYRVLADWDYNLRCWSRTGFRHINRVIAEFRLGGLSSSAPDPDFHRDVAQNVLEYFGWSMLHPKVNSRKFVGCTGIANLQKSRSLFHYLAGKILRFASIVNARLTQERKPFGSSPFDRSSGEE
jgi:glycosyltransferase involved in cell wall biosynthesis